MPRSLYFPTDPNILVLGIENAVGTDPSSQPIEVLRSGNISGFKTGQLFTYSQLLDVIIKAEKVITL
jgi:hypothetical protein